MLGKLNALQVSSLRFNGLASSKLQHLNFSFNNLSGSIPISLQKFPKESFLGNSLLCDPPLKQCLGLPPSHLPSPSVSPEEHKKGFWKRLSLKVVIAISAGVLALMLLIVIILLISILMRQCREGDRPSKEKVIITGARGVKTKEDNSSGVQETKKNKLAVFGECSCAFDLEDLLRASAEVLGKGSYGTAYKAVFEDGL